MTDTPTVEQRPFEREERYIVIKLKRLQEGAREPLRRYLHHLNIRPIECVVVEADWPEHELVWRMIEARVARTQQPRPDTSVEGLAGELAEMIAEVEQDRIDDANAAEDAGERPDLWDYEVCLDLDKAKAILAALTTREAVVEEVDLGAINALRLCQQQLDEDGVFVGVSRQALDELLNWFDSVTSDAVEAEIRALAAKDVE